MQAEKNLTKHIMKRSTTLFSLLGVLVLSLCFTVGYAQCDGDNASYIYGAKSKSPCKTGFALVIADSNGQHVAPTSAMTLPHFKGGNKAMCRYINKTMVYPANLKSQRVSGTTVVQAKVKADSTLSDIEVVSSSGYKEFDDEALRIVKSFPNLVPSTQSCEAQDLLAQFTINFNIEEEEERDRRKAEEAENKAMQEEIDKIGPITLYFDNDQPDPRTVKENTDKQYMDLYENYKVKKNEYSQKSTTADAKAAIASFFDDEVYGGKDRLEKMTSSLIKVLKKGKHVSFNISGFASPLANSDYNKHLSARRIESVLNYMKQADGGFLAPYINGEKSGLTIYKNPSGEVKDNSDKNTTQGVYGLTAAKDRKIVIDNIQIR